MLYANWKRLLKYGKPTVVDFLAYADWCEENGKLQEGVAYREYAGKEYRPCQALNCYRRSRIGWLWLNPGTKVDVVLGRTVVLHGDSRSTSEWAIPDPSQIAASRVSIDLYSCLPQRHGSYAVHNSCYHAQRSLITAIRRRNVLFGR